MQNLLAIEIWKGQTLADLLTLQFLISILGSIFTAVIIVVLGFTLAGWVRRRIRRIAFRHRHLDQTLFQFLGDIAWYAIIAFTVMFVLNTFGIQTTSLVAVIGAAGLAIGLALQGTLSNIAAGVMLIFFRPIKVGDFVVVGDVMGTVKDISLNYTEIANLGNVQIIVPNSAVWGQTITNYSVYDKRQIEWTFRVGYGANLAQAEQVIRSTIMADPRSHPDPAPFIQVNNLGDFSVDFLVRVWCDAAVAFDFETDMKRAVKEALDTAGIPIPSTTRIKVHEETPSA